MTVTPFWVFLTKTAKSQFVSKNSDLHGKPEIGICRSRWDLRRVLLYCAWPFRETRGDDAHVARWCAAAKVGDLA
jgi:hypothetical protein